jgi:8-hydroxy-5-deazaflavin:NADPH oxidoreductase
MRLGIFGSGMIGGTLARLWLDAGHEVRFGARDPERTRLKARSIDSRAGVMALAEAAGWGEAFLLAIPLHATPETAAVIAPGVRGKVVLDAGNAIPRRDGAVGTEALRDGSGAWVASHLPGAHVVKAFNTVYFKTIAAAGQGGGDKVGVPLAGDDEAALTLAERLVRDAGLEPVRVGSLAESGRIDFGSPVWNTGMSPREIRRTLGLR